MYPCSTKRMEGLENPFPTAKISREISRVEGNVEKFPAAEANQRSSSQDVLFLLHFWKYQIVFGYEQVISHLCLIRSNMAPGSVLYQSMSGPKI